MTPTTHDRAIVLGGSIAGLLAARVLAERFAEVVVIERDGLDDAIPSYRRGVPQGRHIHALLPRGQQALEQLFPGLTAELGSAGAAIGDLLADSTVVFGGHLFCRGTSGLTIVCVSRALLEWTIRRRVLGLPAVQVRGGHAAVGLTFDRRNSRVVAAKIVRRSEGSAEEELTADLVVDATGRGSHLSQWLASNGWPQPRKEQVRVGVGYASRRYRTPAEVLGDDISMVSAPTPDRPRGGAVARIEDGQCLVTLMGLLGDHPPVDPDGFQKFGDELRLTEVPEIMRLAEPVDEPVAFRYPTVTWHRYDLLRQFPEGLAIVGDAVCSLNPIYGQGMTVAALEAIALGDRLASGQVLDTRNYLRDLGRITGGAWALALGADLGFPEIEGPRTPATRFLGWYVDRVQAAAVHDPRMGSAFAQVAGLVDRPQALFRPRVLAGALGVGVRGRGPVRTA